ncbi:hypothetical protein FRACYDRAFT_247371 [Fragilariopsis cylindrus CCMP1102]|uniref:PDZ domain-containing protein n=1 Tax=Fragilariopsis cylindrus CCMP1102 TaxID=635003 RepID=A0A1E7EXT5_9STRA|nr:hypothetical protein FRACYDRAFT_247371 [Fragilariopsis cylindrus CCMP1102]|eukprot:OEU10343.1 hypothetical protein FRACYDRAFT_247371 [Fragilariopsis cylindrus CCMP1102]
MSTEQREQHRLREKDRRANMSVEEKLKVKEINRVRERERRMKMSTEQKDAARERNRIRSQQARRPKQQQQQQLQQQQQQQQQMNSMALQQRQQLELQIMQQQQHTTTVALPVVNNNDTLSTTTTTTTTVADAMAKSYNDSNNNNNNNNGDDAVTGTITTTNIAGQSVNVLEEEDDNNSIESDDNTEIPENHNYAKLHPVSTKTTSTKTTNGNNHSRTTSRPDDGLSNYERLRLERIKRNQERLQQLGLHKSNIVPLKKKKEEKKKKKQPSIGSLQQDAPLTRAQSKRSAKKNPSKTKRDNGTNNNINISINNNENNNDDNNNKSERTNESGDDDDNNDCRHNNLTTTVMAARTTNRSHINNSDDDDNPFCLLCSHNYPSVRIHHPWCSKNPQRDTEKVDELLYRIKHGVNKLQCNACQTEYQTGKQVITNNTSKKFSNNANDGTTMVRHNQACLIYQKQLRNVRRQREKEEEESEELEDEPKKARTMKKKRRVSTTGTATSSQSRKSNEEEDDDDEDDRSVFEPATKKTRQMQALTFSSYNKQTVAAATANDNDSSSDNNNDSRIKPRWVPLSDDEQDPWGEEGWQIEDSLLYGPQRGTGHLVSNNRYAMNPFEIGSNYHRTHGTPVKGLSIIGLTRDPLGKFPWGFVVTRHELGLACIVETVHQNTPASAATFVGVPSNDKDLSSSASLNINDMIMMINGKIVGGMSEVEFNLELEMNSPNLILGISKYKHAETVERNFTILEQRLLHYQDSVARDNRMIGWQEIGNGSVPTAPVRTPLLAERRIEDVSLTTQDEFGSNDAIDNDDEAIATNTDPDDEVADMTSQQQSKAS